MNPRVTRRTVAVASLATGLACALPAAAQTPIPAPALGHAQGALAALETRHGGRLGVAVIDTGSGRRTGYRATERFAMCSTHKLLTAAAILTLVDRGQIQLSRHIPYGSGDLLPYAPITRRNLGAGFMTVGALCAAAIEWSDNTAENLLLGLVGGPAGWTRYVRSIGDETSRLDRTEPTLNTAIPGDPRDTTTPKAMLRNLQVVLLGTALSAGSRSQLNAWLLAGRVTDTLLRAALPQGWRVGDKSGSGDHGTRNDIGIILPPRTAPILAAVYYTGSREPPATQDAVIAQVGRVIGGAFAA